MINPFSRLMSLTILISLNSFAGNQELKNAFKNLSVESRNEAISKAEVFKASPLDKVDLKTDFFSVSDWLQRECGPEFLFKRSKSTSLWPEVTCNYVPDDGGFGGATAKLKCQKAKPESSSEVEEIKVKYAEPGKRLSQVEIGPSFIAATAANLMGFYSNVYCPAQIICKNCPSENPWRNNRSAAPAGNLTATFPMALIEIQPKSMNIRNPGPDSHYAQGLNFDELQILSESPEVRRQQIIEREAFMIWHHFLVDLDAFHFNQRIACKKGEFIEGKAVCETSIVYTHDHGHAFFDYLQLEKWMRQPLLISSPDGTCRGGVTEETFFQERKKKYKNKWLGASISAEARDLFLGKFQKITEENWREIFELSRAVEVSSWLNKVNFEKFIEGVRAKVRQLKEAQCTSIDSGRTLFSEI